MAWKIPLAALKGPHAVIAKIRAGQAAARAAGGDYWVARVLDNMYTESWARGLWSRIGLDMATADPAEAGRRLAAIMANPEIRALILGEEKRAETKEREEKKAGTIAGIATVLGVAGLVGGLASAASRRAAGLAPTGPIPEAAGQGAPVSFADLPAAPAAYPTYTIPAGAGAAAGIAFPPIAPAAAAAARTAAPALTAALPAITTAAKMAAPSDFKTRLLALLYGYGSQRIQAAATPRLVTQRRTAPARMVGQPMALAPAGGVSPLWLMR